MNFLDLLYLNQIWHVFHHYLFKYSLYPFLFSHSENFIMPILVWLIVFMRWFFFVWGRLCSKGLLHWGFAVGERLSSAPLFIFIPPFLRLENFSWPVFRFANYFLPAQICYWILLMDRSFSVIILFSSRISFWFLFRFYISLLIFLFFYVLFSWIPPCL